MKVVVHPNLDNSSWVAGNVAVKADSVSDPGPPPERPRAILSHGSIRILHAGSGSLIHNRGYFGQPLPGGGLTLSPLEALYLNDAGRIRLVSRGRPVTRSRLLRLMVPEHPHPEVVALVYRDMRARGLVVLEDGPGRLKVLPRGGTPQTSASRTLLLPVAERDRITFSAGQRLARDGQGRRKAVNIGVVDAESDVTYYSPTLPRLPAAVIEARPPEPVQVELFGDRATTQDPGVESLRQAGWYGKFIGELLHLSLLETLHLATIGSILVRDGNTGRQLTAAGLMGRVRRRWPELIPRFVVYSDLRGRGLVVKTGFKYGTHFRVYAGDPEKNHARWLIQVVDLDQELAWWELSRGVRLAHGVRKEIMWAAPGTAGVGYLKLGWVRP